MTSPSRPLKSSRPRKGRGGPKRASPAVGGTVVRDWNLVRSRLAPIIGEDGFRVLFARSLHRARAEHPWLAREAVSPDDPFASLTASLASQPPERGAQGIGALVAHFDDLLHALIGEELAARLLLNPSSPPQRTNQETDR
jgi:hypothetical protein